MATYTEIRQLFDDDALGNRVEVACVIAANNLLANTPGAKERAFADTVFAQPGAYKRRVLMALLAKNKDATVAAIQGAPDATIQSAVDSVLPSLVDAMAGV